MPGTIKSIDPDLKSEHVFMEEHKATYYYDTPVADPGFPRGGAANSPGGGPTYDFAKFSQKLNEIERIWTPGMGARPSPPLRSATALCQIDKSFYVYHFMCIILKAALYNLLIQDTD